MSHKDKFYREPNLALSMYGTFIESDTSVAKQYHAPVAVTISITIKTFRGVFFDLNVEAVLYTYIGILCFLSPL